MAQKERSIFAFEIHHIFPEELFKDEKIAAAFDQLFPDGSDGIFKDASSNTIALFVHAQTAAMVQAAIANGAGDYFLKAGFGPAEHNGGHKGYNDFMINAVKNVLTNPDLANNPAAQRAALFDLHKFGSDLAKGNIKLDDGTILGVKGGGAYQSVLKNAYGNDFDPLNMSDLQQAELNNYMNGFDSTLVDADSARNTKARFDVVKALVLSAPDGTLTPDQKADYLSALAGIEPKLGTFLETTVAGMISSVGIASLHDIAKNTGGAGPDSLAGNLQYLVAKFTIEQNGALSAEAFNKAMASATQIAQGFDQLASKSISNLNQLGDNLLSSMAGSLNNVLVGIGGGVIGDAVEFLNHAYDALHTLKDTGDPSDLIEAVATFGVGAVLSAIAIGVTVAAAGPFGFAVAAAWAAYGVYDALNNGSELLEKVMRDYGDAVMDNLEELVQDLNSIINRRPVDPLVIDLDGDGVELLSVDESEAKFDLDGDGFAETTGWVGSDDGLLAIDLNGNGVIDDIGELLGSDTQSAFDALAELDSNGDNVIDELDDDFSSLLIWQDADGDGYTDEYELSSVTDWGISSISLDTTPSNTGVAGNIVVQTSEVEFEDGTTSTASELLFDVDQVTSDVSIPDDYVFDVDILTLPHLHGFGDIGGLAIAMSMDTELEQEAVDLIDEARTTSLDAFYDGFDSFLAGWAGVEDVQWVMDIPHLNVSVAYDVNSSDVQDALEALNTAPAITTEPQDDLPYFNNSVGKAYVFSYDFSTWSQDGVDEWLAENDLIASTEISIEQITNLVCTNGELSLPLSFQAAFPGQLSSGTLSGWDLPEEPESPSIAAHRFAFLQKLMGQEYQQGSRHFAPEDVLINMPTDEDAIALDEAFEQYKEYAAKRFLVQSVTHIYATEGVDADLGNLAPFAHLNLNPFTDKIFGDTVEFATDFIEMYRADGLGTDAEALAFIAKFKADFPELGAIIAAEFPDIDRVAIEAAFGYESILDGTAGSDVLDGTNSDVLIGDAGDDTLTSHKDGTFLIGGAGDDILNGSERSDTYIYRLGDGSDTITDFDPSLNTGRDHLLFADLNSNEVAFGRNGSNDLVITLPNGEVVTIKNHFDSDYDFGMDQISFSDGVTLGWQGIRDKSVADQKASGSGVVTGTELAENYQHTSGDGSYVITDYDPGSNSATDTLTFTDVASTDAVFSKGDTNDLVITLPNGETVTINNHFDSDYDYGMDQISFSDGVTLDWQGIRDKSVADQKASGSGAITGTEYAENYQHTSGDGSYVITDGDWGSNSGTDTLTFTDVASTDAVFSIGATNDLVITLPNGEVVTINNHFDSDYDYGMDQISFSDGVTLDWQGIRDKSVADQKASGSGAITGTEYAENYLHTSGDGSYVITDGDWGSNSGTDTLTFTDVASTDAIFSKGATNDLVITLPNGETVTINNHYDSDYDYGMDQISFSDGVTLDWQGIRDKQVADQKAIGASEVKGSEYAENYLHTSGDGSYVITDYDPGSNSATDTFTFTDVNVDDVTFHHGAGNDLIMTLQNGETITIKHYFDTDWDYRIERIGFADGTVLGDAEINNKTVADMKPTGTVIGTEVTENYLHTSGDGSYEITDYDPGNNSATDTFEFVDVTASEVSFSRNAENDLIMTLQNGEEITINNHFDDDWDYKMEEFHFSDGSVLDQAQILDLVSDTAA